MTCDIGCHQSGGQVAALSSLMRHNIWSSICPEPSSSMKRWGSPDSLYRALSKLFFVVVFGNWIFCIGRTVSIRTFHISVSLMQPVSRGLCTLSHLFWIINHINIFCFSVGKKALIWLRFALCCKGMNEKWPKSVYLKGNWNQSRWKPLYLGI